jgi:hypothetical protein
MRQLPDVENMSRQLLLDYCHVNVPTAKPNQDTKQLRSTVFSHVFSSFINNADDNQLETIFQNYHIKQNKNKPQWKGQLLNFFQQSNTKTEILN